MSEEPIPQPTQHPQQRRRGNSTGAQRKHQNHPHRQVKYRNNRRFKKGKRKGGKKRTLAMAREKIMEANKPVQVVREIKMGEKDLRKLVWLKLEKEGRSEALHKELAGVEVLSSLEEFIAVTKNNLHAKTLDGMRKQMVKESVHDRVMLRSSGVQERRLLRESANIQLVGITEVIGSDSSDEGACDVKSGSESVESVDSIDSHSYDGTDDSGDEEDEKSKETGNDLNDGSDGEEPYHPIKFGAKGIELTELDKNSPLTGSLNFRLKSNTTPPVQFLFDQTRGRRNSIGSNQGLRHSTIQADSNLVLDCGSTTIKCGIAGEDVPRHLIPSILAKYKEDDSQFVGGLQASKLIQSTTPIELDDFDQPVEYSQFTYSNPLDPNGIDWDDTTLMWEYLFSDIYEVDPEDHNVMMIETPDMSWTGRAETMEILFEVFNVPKLKISNSGLMSLYGLGELNGLVVDLGRRLQIIPVVDGLVEKHNAYNLTKGISESEDHFSRLLRYAGYSLDIQNNKEYQILKELKENCCYVAQDYDMELLKPRDELVKNYTGSNGVTYSLGEERFQCAEPIFNPSLQGHLEKEHSLQTIVFNAIKKCPIDSRRSLFGNIMLVGGGSCYQGLPERLEKEIQILADTKIKKSVPVKVVAEDNRKYLPWIGASLFAGFPTFEDYAIWQDDYNERGSESLAQETMYT